MQGINLVCIVDGSEYKEYEVSNNDRTLGVISWKNPTESVSGCWYTTASDGHPRYFQTQQEVIEFLQDDPLKSANEISAKLKAEASNLIALAEQVEEKSAGFKPQEPC